MCMVVDVKTTEADVIAYYISFLLTDVVANIFVAGLLPDKSLCPATNFGSVLEKN